MSTRGNSTEAARAAGCNCSCMTDRLESRRRNTDPCGAGTPARNHRHRWLRGHATDDPIVPRFRFSRSQAKDAKARCRWTASVVACSWIRQNWLWGRRAASGDDHRPLTIAAQAGTASSTIPDRVVIHHSRGRATPESGADVAQVLWQLSTPSRSLGLSGSCLWT